MYLKSIHLEGFRNLTSQSFEFSPGLISVFGDNGQGKTSFLEAVFILSYARSFRCSKISEVCSILDGKKRSGTHVTAQVSTSIGNLELEIGITGGKRSLALNSKKINQADSFCGKLKSVIFTPDDLDLVKGAPVIRRQFLDRTLVMLDTKYLNLITEYAKVLKFRNALLKDSKIKEAKLLIPKIAELNHEIIAARLDLVKSFEPLTRSYYSKIAGEGKESLKLELSSNFVSEGNLFTKDKIISLFEDASEKEFYLKRTCYGSHKDELKIIFTSDFGSKISRGFSSQGQSRTQAVSLKLAAAELIFESTGEWPVLLLDDVESEFDKNRRLALFELLSEYEGQVFITGTDEIQNEALNIAQSIRVNQGNLELKSQNA